MATDEHLQASIAADIVLFPEDERQIFRRSAEDAARPEELPFYNQMVGSFSVRGRSGWLSNERLRFRYGSGC